MCSLFLFFISFLLLCGSSMSAPPLLDGLQSWAGVTTSLCFALFPHNVLQGSSLQPKIWGEQIMVCDDGVMGGENEGWVTSPGLSRSLSLSFNLLLVFYTVFRNSPRHRPYCQGQRERQKREQEDTSVRRNVTLPSSNNWQRLLCSKKRRLPFVQINVPQWTGWTDERWLN